MIKTHCQKLIRFMKQEYLIHPFAPVCNNNSRILILGSFPSRMSRQNCFYYGHPQNRFWPLMAMLFETALPRTIEEKKQFLLQNRIALWDVYQSCEIRGSADGSIASGKVNDIPALIQKTEIQKIFLNGRTAQQALLKAHPVLEKQSLYLPSTSPANAAWSLERLAASWNCIREELVRSSYA